MGRQRHWRNKFQLRGERFKTQNFIAKISYFLPPPHPRVLILDVLMKKQACQMFAKKSLCGKPSFILKLCLIQKFILTLV